MIMSLPVFVNILCRILQFQKRKAVCCSPCIFFPFLSCRIRMAF